jgi:cytochrome P450
MLCVNPWVIHRSKEIFGDDANEFNPERWLGPNSKGLEHYFIPVRYLTIPLDEPRNTNYNYLLVS